MFVTIDDIENATNKTLNIEFEEFIDGINSKEPIKAQLELQSLGDLIKVTGFAKGIAILQCDLCLENFDYKIDINIEELFAKNCLIDEQKDEIEIKEGNFVTDLNGASQLDITDLLYQSVILDFPNKKVCGINCKGGDIFIREDENETADKEIDPRMAIFKSIRLEK